MNYEEEFTDNSAAGNEAILPESKEVAEPYSVSVGPEEDRAAAVEAAEKRLFAAWEVALAR